MSLEPESALAELLDDDEPDYAFDDDFEWFEHTDGRPRVETIQPAGGVL